MPQATLENTAAARPADVVQHDPAWVVQCAWSVLRLPRLQELVRMTIVDLHALAQPELLGREFGRVTRRVGDPVAEALQACCEELRDEAGMPGAAADRERHRQVIRGHIEREPLAWSEAFSHALDAYRRAATRALEHAFTKATAAP